MQTSEIIQRGYDASELETRLMGHRQGADITVKQGEALGVVIDWLQTEQRIATTTASR